MAARKTSRPPRSKRPASKGKATGTKRAAASMPRKSVPPQGYGAREAQEVEVRTLDGSGNNLANSHWGAVGEQLLRLAPPHYEGGVSRPAGLGRPNPSRVSEVVCNQGRSKPHPSLTDVMWAWGQFVDHEIDLTPESMGEPFPIPPVDERGLPKRPEMAFERSIFDTATGRGPGNPRQQVNVLSAYIDGANVYGADANRAAYLRRHDGSGKLRTQHVKGNELLPYNEHVLPNASMGDPRKLFIAGDIRANEHAVLTSMHTLFVLEHNRWCGRLKSKEKDPAKRDEITYQRARRRVGAIMQSITYGEFLPGLLGEKAFAEGGRIGPYRGYDPTLDAGIANLFSTACYRLGHSMLSPKVVLAGSADREVDFASLFFDPKKVENEGIAPYLVGITKQCMQQIDVRTVDAVRKTLFGMNRDLAALNIQRGRDHGLPTLNQARVALGLRAHRGFDDVTKDKGTKLGLRRAYDHPDDIDVWVGGLAEDHVEGPEVGELFHVVLCDQFRRLRDGDRFWYENDPAFKDSDRKAIRETRLSDVLYANLGVRTRRNVFRI